MCRYRTRELLRIEWLSKFLWYRLNHCGFNFSIVGIQWYNTHWSGKLHLAVKRCCWHVKHVVVLLARMCFVSAGFGWGLRGPVGWLAGGLVSQAGLSTCGRVALLFLACAATATHTPGTRCAGKGVGGSRSLGDLWCVKFCLPHLHHPSALCRLQVRIPGDGDGDMAAVDQESR